MGPRIVSSHAPTEGHTKEHASDAIHIPAYDFTLFHRSTGGGSMQINTAMQQKRQEFEEVDCKQVNMDVNKT